MQQLNNSPNIDWMADWIAFASGGIEPGFDFESDRTKDLKWY